MPSSFYLLIADLYRDEFINAAYCGGKEVYLGGVANGSEKELEALRARDGLEFQRLPKTPVEHRPADISLSHGFVPIVSARVAEVLSTMAPDDVELFRGAFAGDKEPLFLVNVLKRGEAYIDRKLSQYTTFPDDQGVPPWMVGKIQYLDRLVLDVEKTRDVHIVRPMLSHVCVSRALWEALEGLGGLTGVKVTPTEKLR